MKNVPSKVTIGAGLLVDWLPEIKLLDNVPGSQVKVLLDDGENLGISLCPGSISVHVDGHGLGHANGVGELDKTAARELGVYNGFLENMISKCVGTQNIPQPIAQRTRQSDQPCSSPFRKRHHHRVRPSRHMCRQ